MIGLREIMSQTKRIHRLSLVAALVFFCLTDRSPAAQKAVASEPRTITLALISMNQKEIEEHFQPFVRYVATKLSGVSSVDGRTVVVPTQSHLANLLLEKKADFYMESPYPTYQINSVYSAAKLLLRRWKGGMSDYHTLIFTRKDGAIKRLDDLRGHMIAFEDPESTSGHFLPKLFLSRKGYKLVRKSQIEPNVPAAEVGYFFAETQDKIMDLVLTQRVAAGAFSNDDFAALDSGKKAEIIILGATASLPRHLVSVRKDLPPATVDRLKSTLLSMHQEPEGHSILEKLDGTTKFDTLPGGELAISQRLLDTFYSPEKR